MRPFSNAVNIVLRFLLLLVVFAISMLIGGLYTGGDQISYTKVYESIGSMGLVDAFSYYTFNLGSIELIHFIFIWSLSHYLPKVLLFSIINTILAGLIVRLFDSLRVNFLVTSVFLLTNFYLYVLFFAAERLKFGFILLVLGLSMQAGKKLKIPVILMSFTAHFQMILVVFPKVFEMVVNRLVGVVKVQKFNLRILLLIIPPLLMFPSFPEYLIRKVQAYESTGSVFDYTRVSLFLLLSLWYIPNRKGKRYAFMMFLVLYISVYFFGDARVNMIAYIYFLMFALGYRNGINIGILITSIYFFVKTIIFVNNIVQFSHGFP